MQSFSLQDAQAGCKLSDSRACNLFRQQWKQLVDKLVARQDASDRLHPASASFDRPTCPNSLFLDRQLIYLTNDRSKQVS